MADTNPKDLVAEIMKETRIATLTYVDAEGRLVSTPMGTQDFEDPGTVWFITELDTDKVAAIRERPAVNISYASDTGWVSYAGSATISTDRAKLEELWDPSVSAYMKGDAQDPNNGLIEVTADTAEYWESPRRRPCSSTSSRGSSRTRRPRTRMTTPVGSSSSETVAGVCGRGPGRGRRPSVAAQ